MARSRSWCKTHIGTAMGPSRTGQKGRRFPGGGGHPVTEVADAGPWIDPPKEVRLHAFGDGVVGGPVDTQPDVPWLSQAVYVLKEVTS